MPINFPNSPSPNQQYTYDNKTWEWNGIYWEVYSEISSYITGATSVGSGLTIFDSVTNRRIQINSITGDSSNKVSTTLNSNTIELGVNEQNLTLWDLVVQGNKLLNGSVSYVSGLTFSVSPLEYLINGQIYTISAETTVTLASGDSTFDRIDVIYADISGNTGVLQGVPSANPEKALVDGDTEVEVTFVLVRANSTSADVSTFVIYNENSGPPSEWTFGSGGVQPTRIIGNFTGVTYSGGTSIRVSGVTGAYTTFFRLTGSTTLNTNNYSTLQFAIRNLSANTTTSLIRFRFLTTGGTQNGSVVTMNGAGTANVVQYSPTNVSTWQLISIPLWRFYLTNTNVQVLEVSFSPQGTGAQSRYYFDLLEFVEGTSSAPPSNSWTTIQGDSAATTITAPNPNATLILSGGTNISTTISGTSTVVFDLDNNIRLGGVSATTISATTYQNLPISGLTAGQNINISGTSGNLTISFTGTTGSNFTGGTVTGPTNFTNGLTANTISATTYQNLPVTADTYVTGFTLSANTITLSQNRIDSYSSFTISLSAYTGSSVSGAYLPLSGGTVTGGTIFQSGLTANTISATTYLNLPVDVFVTGGTYTSGNAIFTNNTGGTFTVSGFNTGGGGGQIFYLNISQSKNGNRYLSTTASTAAEQSTGVTIANGVTSTIASFQSDQLNIILIPSGVWSFHLHSYKSNINATFDIFVEVYKRTSGGTETLLFTTEPTPVISNSPTVTMEISEAYFSGSPVVVTDSIVAVVRATNTSDQSYTITFFTEGSQHYSYVISTLPTQQGLTCDTLSGCSIIQTIQTDVSNKFDKSGGTINGNVLVQNGLTATTISATTISGDTLYGDGSNLTNVPNIYNSDGFLTGQRTINLNNNDLFIKDDLWGLNYNFYTKLKFSIFNDSDPTTEFSVTPATGEVSVGGPFQTANSIVVLNNLSADNTTPYLLGLDVTNNVRTFDANYIYNSITGGSFSADTLYLTNNTGGTVLISGFTSGSSSFTGGTVSGSTNFTNGLTANTISATTYQNLPTDIRVTGATYSNNTFTYTNNTGGTFNVLFNSVSGLTVQGLLTSNSLSTITLTGSSEFINYRNPVSQLSTLGIDAYSVLKIQGSYIYSLSPLTSNFQITDVSNPNSPSLISTTNVAKGGSPPNDLYINGRYAYIVYNGTGTTIVDIENVKSPIVVYSADTQSSGDSVYVQGTYLYTVSSNSNRLFIYDISLATSPVLVSSINTISIPYYVYIQGNYAYVVGGVPSGSLQIIDISKPSSPSIIGSGTTSGSTPTKVYVQGRYAYVSNVRSSNFTVIDVSNPTSPSVVSQITIQNSSDFYIQGNYAYVASNLFPFAFTGINNTVSVVSISNPNSLSVLNSFTVNGYPTSVIVQGKYLYVSDDGLGSQIFDLGSSYIQQLEAGGIETTTLTTLSNAIVGNDLTVVGGMNVNQSLNVQGDISARTVRVLPSQLTVNSISANTDASLSSTFTLTLTGNTLLTTPTNGYPGQRLLYQLKQDGSGNRTLTLSSGFRSGPITVTLSTAANTTDYLGVIYNAIDNKWDVLGLNKGYS